MTKPPATPPPERRHVRETGERTLHTYHFLYESARRSLQHAKEKERGSFWFLMSTGVFSAFTAEAYFNHLGSLVFPFWTQLERLSPVQKAEVLVSRLTGQPVDWSQRPFQSLRQVFWLRDRLAHGRTETITFDDVTTLDVNRPDPFMDPRLLTDWERLCRNVAAMERLLADVREIVDTLCAAHKPNTAAFDGMMATFSGRQELMTAAEAIEHRRTASKKQKRAGKKR